MSMKNVFRIAASKTQGQTIVVADSPHSGTVHPPDFRPDCDALALRGAEDFAVDQLYDFLPGLGVPFLQAEFPRSYIDANRLDNVTDKFKAEGEQDYDGHESSLAREKISPRDRRDIYAKKMKLSEVFNRVAGYHKPYHDALAAMIDDAAQRHGRVVHLNLHSMPSTTNGGKGVNKYDVIIGTRLGTAADMKLAEKLRDLFAARGYAAAIDVPGYSGAEILRRSGNPAAGRHSLQVEINRRLYMDEKTITANANMPLLKKDLQGIMADFIAWCDVNVAAPAARTTPKQSPPLHP